MKSPEKAETGHLRSGGPLMLMPTKAGQRKGAIAANRANAERRNPAKPIELGWKAKK